MSTRRTGGWIASAALVLVVAGCGSEPAPVSDFRAGADKLCTESQAEQEGIRRDSGPQRTLADRAALLVAIAPSRAQLASDLAALESPTGEEDAVAQFVGAQRDRARASTAAGRLFEAGAPNARVAAAAADEHDARLRAVAAARRLGLEECGERLSPDARAEITETATEAFTVANAADRCALIGERLKAELYGGDVVCEHTQERGGPASSVTVSQLQGIADVFAIARADVVGGTAPGSYRLRFTFEDGRYKLDLIDRYGE